MAIIDKNVICLFDMDGTLTEPRKKISAEIMEFLKKLRTHVKIGLVGGSDLSKICEQMGGDEVLHSFDYVFAENGLVAYKNGKLIGKESILNKMGEEKLQKVINFCLCYMSKLTLPAKRGNFIEFRNGLINVCPVGRSCNQSEREEFNKYDNEFKIRETFVQKLKDKFPDLGLTYAIGGQISFDVFPNGWDKTYCLQYLEKDGIKTIYFFGDKTSAGENDYEIFTDSRTIGHTVKGPKDTKELLNKLYFF